MCRAGALDNLARVLRLDSIERIQFFQLAPRQPVIVLVQPPVRTAIIDRGLGRVPAQPDERSS